MKAQTERGMIHLNANMKRLEEDKLLIKVTHSVLVSEFNFDDCAQEFEDESEYFLTIAAPKHHTTLEIKCDYSEAKKIAKEKIKNGDISEPKKQKPRVTYRQVKRALRKGWVSPLNGDKGKFELPSWRVVPVKQVHSIVVYEGGRWIAAQGENVSGFATKKQAMKRSYDFHQITRIIEHDDNDASFYKELEELNG